VGRIVVADDDEDIRDLVVLKLRSSGHDVTAVGDGAAAVEAARSGAPDLVVLDVMMPGMSGIEACRAIRAEPLLAATPVLLLTARARTTDIAEGLDAGATDYLVKPFSPRELASRVATLLGDGVE
jgi:two-component system, OmpR family, response regulator MtrA